MSAAILVADLHVTLGGREILHGVDLAVEHGDVFGFVGPNGAGKTTTLRTILGLYRPTSGSVRVMGHEAGSDEARRATGFALDRDGLYDAMTAAENIAFYQRLYGGAPDRARITDVLALVGLAARADDRVGTFSSGMRRRAALARAIAHRPAVLVLDEPTSGVDPVAQAEIRGLLLDIVRAEGTTVLLSSHNLDEVQRLCGRIAIIADGEIRVAGDLAELRRRLGRHSISVRTVEPVTDAAVAALRADVDLGLGEAQGTRLTFLPPHPIRAARIVARLAALDVDIVRLVADDASVEDLFASAVLGPAGGTVEGAVEEATPP